MKDVLLNQLKNIKEDAKFFIYVFLDNGRFKSEFKTKPYVMELLNKGDDIYLHKELSNCVVINGIGVSITDFSDSIVYETENVEGFEEHVSKYNPYHKVYIKLDKENKVITFKLGQKEKTLELIERTEYVSRPYKRKYMKCSSAERLEKHIQDDFWNPRMVEIGRHVLGFKDLKLA